VPLMAGAFWKRATTQGALLSIVLGIGTWLGATQLAPGTLVPANLLGLAASFIGMLMGSLAPQLIANKGHSIAAALKHGQATLAKEAHQPGHRPGHHA
jgi:solute:Na+ symporter, SSS family